MLNNADRVRETSTTTGTGTYSLAGAVTGYRTFVAGVGDTNTCHYLAEDGVNWEVGLGAVADATPDTLTRTRIFASSNSGAAVNWSAGTRTIACVPVAAAIRDNVVPKGYIWDLTMSNAADTVNDITISAGEAADESGETVMVLPTAITKRLDAAWAVGSGNGGLNTGSVAADTWYEVHLIKRQDSGVVDAMFTTTANRATLPSGYTHQRRIGWIRRNGSTILQFTQVGDYVTLATPINDVSATFTTTETAVTLTAPPNSMARFRASATGNTSVNSGVVLILQEIVEGTVTPSDTTGLASLAANDLANHADAGHYELRVSATSQIEHDAEAATGSPTFDISTFGWIDRRRRNEPI